MWSRWHGAPGQQHLFDDDGDGTFDEERLNGLDDDHDGEVDEDLGVFAQQMMAADYRDDRPESGSQLDASGEVHARLWLTVHQETYSWSTIVSRRPFGGACIARYSGEVPAIHDFRDPDRLPWVAVLGLDHPVDPLAPAPPPPAIVEVFPGARATALPIDTQAWVRFAAPLDSTTVRTTSVFLKLDTRRIPIEVEWDEATLRIVITALEPLTPARTHTLVLSDALRARDGTPLDAAYEWQFRVIGVRRPEPQLPAAGATFQSPLTHLGWSGTEAAVGAVEYAVFVGADSAPVALRAVPELARVGRPFLVPVQGWSIGATVWWSVNAINRTLDESSNGPTVRFESVPAGTRIDSTQSSFQIYGWKQSTGAFSCSQAVLLAGNDYVNAVRMNLAGLAGLPIAAVRIETNTSDTSSVPTVWGVTETFNVCTLQFPGTPRPDTTLGALASAARVSGTRRLRFTSDRLGAFTSWALNGSNLAGFTFRFGSRTDLISVNQSPTPPFVRIFYYVPPAPRPDLAK